MQRFFCRDLSLPFVTGRVECLAIFNPCFSSSVVPPIAAALSLPAPAALSDTFGTNVFEDLSINRMVKKHSPSSAIMDTAWGKLRQLSAYKAERRGGRIILVEPSGSSQDCWKTVEKDLYIRTHHCPRSGLVLDRDVNAAINILARGLERALWRPNLYLSYG